MGLKVGGRQEERKRSEAIGYKLQTSDSSPTWLSLLQPELCLVIFVSLILGMELPVGKC